MALNPRPQTAVPVRPGHHRRRALRAAALAMIITLAAVSAADAQVDYRIVTAFEAAMFDGAYPLAELIEATDGSFYGTTSRGGLGYGTVFKIDTAGTFTTVHRFENGLDGGSPRAGLILATDGNFYGTTSSGGGSDGSGSGTVFRMDTSGRLTTLHAFSGPDGAGPFAGLVQARNGNFYGTTASGGAYGYGTVFVMNREGLLTPLYSFTGSSDGGVPYGGVIEASDGNFYGTTSGQGQSPGPPGSFGTIFKLDASGTLTTLFQFGSDGVPLAGLIQAADGNLYGITGRSIDNPGMIFKMDLAGTVTQVWAFVSDQPSGQAPVARLLQGADGALYGTTSTGGSHGRGSIFRLDPTGTLTTLHNFMVADGFDPEAALIQARNGNFYGTTAMRDVSGPGALQYGTIFSLDATGGLTTLHTFMGRGGGDAPNALTQARDGSFYGTTSGGGTFARGTVFNVAPTGALTTLYNFSDSTGGAGPVGRLVQTNDGTFYGITGGARPAGLPRLGATIFALDTTGTLTTLHSFPADVPIPFGYSPVGIIQANDGAFYGTTSYGGVGGDYGTGNGTVFKIDASGTFSIVHAFTDDEGGRPGQLTQAADGNFYGAVGGNIPSSGPFNGVLKPLGIYRMDATGAVTILHRFTADHGTAASPLIQGADGGFYGTTTSGSVGYVPVANGTVFKMDPAGTVTVLHAFSGGADGFSPFGGVIQAPDGSLYGTTTGGGRSGSGSVLGPAGYGTVFKVDQYGSFTTLHSFSGADGANPAAPLVQAPDGSFWGTAAIGGPSLGGVVFRLTEASGPTTSPHTIPGRIEAEDYDRGGPGVGYVDSTLGNDGHAYRTDDVDIKTSAEGGFAVGWITAGEWLAYTVNVQSDGLYTLQARVGSALPDRTFHVEIDGRDVTGPLAVPQMADWDQYGTVAVPGLSLHAGVQLLRVVMGPQDWMDFQWIALAKTGETAGPFTGIPWPVPGRIEAENYDLGGQGVAYFDSTAGNEGQVYRNDDVDIKASAEGGYAVGWFTAGEWLAYTVNVQSDGIYTLRARVGSALDGRTFHVEADGHDVTGEIAVPLMADWDQYDIMTLPGLSLHAGVQVLRVVMGAQDWMDLQWIALEKTDRASGPFTGTPWPVPGRIEAENYDLGGQGVGYEDSNSGNEGHAYRNDDVDIKASAEGGYAVGWFNAGEWLAYTVNVQSAGTYTIQARVGSAFPDRTFHLEVDGNDVTGPVSVPQVSDWDQYATVTAGRVSLSAGAHLLRLVMGPEDWMDFQWLELSL